MTFFVWDKSYESGVQEVDDQHRVLVEMINGLHDAMLVGQGAAQLSGLLKELIDYTRYHFQCEEELLKTAGYAELAAHQTEHRMLTEQVLAFQEKDSEGKFTNAVTTSRFLKDWLANHILENDLKAMAHVQKKRNR